MKILVLGATGRTGKFVLQIAEQRGYEVHCLVRARHKVIAGRSVMIFEGDATSEGDLSSAMKGCQAIISVLNISRTSDFPWAKLRTPKTLLSDTMKILIPIARREGISRLVVCSAWGVSETKRDLPSWFRWFIDNSNVGAAYRDHERQEALVMSSGLEWTIVRPAGLLNFKGEQTVIESYSNNPRPGMTINRRTVGRYLVETLDRDDLVRKAVVISA